MQTSTRYTRRAAAAFSAFALSLVLFSGTVTIPRAEAASAAYVGELA